MSDAGNYYRRLREIIWPLLMHRIAKSQPLREQMLAIAASEQSAAGKLLRLPTSKVPAAMVRHAEAWAKHLQAGKAHYDAADAMGLFDPPREPEETSEPGLIRATVGVFFKTFLRSLFEYEDTPRAATSRTASVAEQIAHQKRGEKYNDERTRLVALLERIGADHVPGFKARDYIRLLRWSGTEELHPKECLMGATDAQIEEQLNLLPGGAQLSVVEFHLREHEYLSVYGAVNEDFAFQYNDSTAGVVMESEKDDFTVPAAMEIIRKFLADPDEWQGLLEWKRRER
ncbi:MAG: hypothetical protein JNJ70_24315 [Verrucomicrobiales bacterium]|nr:hypothetical protein [Verrucomicrobiales bacterium]